MSDLSAMLASRRLQVFAPELFQNCARHRQRDDFFFFLKRGGSELVMSKRTAKKNGGGWIGAFQSAFRRIPEEASWELTGEGTKVCVCVDGKARQDLKTEKPDL